MMVVVMMVVVVMVMMDFDGDGGCRGGGSFRHVNGFTCIRVIVQMKLDSHSWFYAAKKLGYRYTIQIHYQCRYIEHVFLSFARCWCCYFAEITKLFPVNLLTWIPRVYRPFHHNQPE